jgi:hypothetical protein
MSKRFLITENERNSILSLYTKKGIILEQKKEPPRKDALKTEVVNTGENENKPFEFGPFNSNTVPDESFAGRIGVVISSGNLYYIKYDRNKGGYTTKGAVDISGKPEDFTVDLNTKTVTNNQFITNMSIVETFGGFSSVLDKQVKPGIYQVLPKFPKGFQTIMINYPENNAPPQIDKFDPYLCSVVLDAKNIEILSRDGVNKRVPSNSSTINLLQYYVPKSKEEWYVMRNNLDSKNTYTQIDFSDWSFRKFKRKNMAIFLSDWWPNSSHGKTVDPTPIPPPKPVSIKISLDIKNPFTFDTTNLEGTGPQDLENFINDVKKQKRMYGEDVYNDYINFLNNYKDEKTGRKGILVTTSASIDRDPKLPTADSNADGSTFPGCEVPGGRTRNSYNFCLSEARAQVILQKLNSDLPEITNFVPNPIGETDMYDKNAKWPKVTGTDEQKKAQTAINRRLIITLPEYNTNLPTN